jgi:hypothetical protein
MHPENRATNDLPEHSNDRSTLTTVIPNVSVGPFRFNDPIESYLNRFRFSVSPEDELGFKTYDIDDPETTLFVKKGRIDFIGLYDLCYLKDQNIIGLTVDEFMASTNAKYYGAVDVADFEEDDIPQYIYDFEDLGLQIWTKGEGGKIVTVIASEYVSES